MNRDLIGELKAWGGVAVIGAGASVSAGMPLSPQLPPLVWHALDRVPGARAFVADQLGLPDDASQRLLGDSAARLRVGYEAIAAYPDARAEFQRAFSARDRENRRRPSIAHEALAGMLHRGILEAAVSLNWDTLVEAAYGKLYGARDSIASLGLFKPHGDAATPELDWVLPHEPGLVPEELLRHLQAIAERRPHVLLIVGYSERDEEVVGRLIAPMADRWRVARIGPGAKGPLDIDVGAARALESLLAELAPGRELPHWNYVTFDRQRDLSFSLAGEKLGAADVAACPPFAEVRTAADRLEATGVVAVHGGSGEGKSVTAYQVARRFLRQGWDVVSPERPDMLDDAALRSLDLAWRPTLVLIDDAQTVPHPILADLRNRVGEGFRLLVTSTEASDLPIGTGVRVDPLRAVSTLRNAFLEREREILPIVSRLDPHVGETYLSEPLGARIAHAAEVSRTPWEFSFVLTAGWRRCSAAVRESRDDPRSDLVLGVVAAHQMLTLDGGVSRGALDGHCRELGLDDVSVALGKLERRRLVVVRGDRIRCLHARLSLTVLSDLLGGFDRDDGRRFVAVLRKTMAERTTSLAGTNWLLDRLWFDDAQRFLHRFGLLDRGFVRALAERCLGAGRGRLNADRIGSAAALLRTLTLWDDATAWSLIEGSETAVAEWCSDCGPDDAYGLGSLFNEMLNDRRELSRRIAGRIDLSRLAAAFGGADGTELARLAAFTDRLGLALDDDRKAEFLQALDLRAVEATLVGLPSNAENIWRISTVATSFTSFGWQACFDLFHAVADKIAEALNQDAIEAYVHLEFHAFQTLVVEKQARSEDAARPGPSVLKRIALALDAGRIAERISRTSLRDGENCSRLLYFLSLGDRGATRRIVESIDLSRLDRTFEGKWGHPPRELYILLQGLASAPSCHVPRRWLRSHEAELEVIHWRLVPIDPELCTRVLRRGGRLELEIAANLGWDHGVETLRLLAAADPEAARAALRGAKAKISRAFALAQANDREDAAAFVRTFARIDRAMLLETIAAVAPSAASEYWPQRMRGSRRDRAMVRLLIEGASCGSGEIADIARQLMAPRKAR